MRPWRVIVAVVSLLAIVVPAGCGDDDEDESKGPAGEAIAGRWKPWVLESGSAIRVPPPPREGSAAAERDEAALQGAVESRTDAQEKMARTYMSTPVVEPWVKQNIELVSSLPKDLPASSRAYSHTAVAMHDAAIAAAYWKERYMREAPEAETVVERTPGPSYPSEHAAIAGAASRTLAALYPDYPAAPSTSRPSARSIRSWPPAPSGRATPKQA